MKKKIQNIGIPVLLILLIGTLFCSVCVSGCEKKTSEKPNAKVKIGANTWVVELAMTKDVRIKGLSGRDNLPDDSGMLFIYPEAAPLNFWMKGCLIPIDIVFIDADLRVVNTYAMKIEPYPGGRRSNYSSGVAVPYALELAGGTVKKCGIKNGDLVEFVDVPDRGRAEAAN